MGRRPASVVLRIGLPLVLVLGAPVAHAQPSTAPEAGLGPVECYRHASDVGLERLKALQLCLGAPSEAPARCLERAIDRVGLSDLQAVRLCRTARSLDPATCAEQLQDRGFEDLEIVDYCAALTWSLVPPPTSGSPACVQAGLDRTFLSARQVIRLCRGSSSSAPIDCFEAGDDATLLGDGALVTLCAPVVVGTPAPGRAY